MSTVRDAERDAAGVLSKWWWDSPSQDGPLPIHPTRIAYSLGIEVREDALPMDESGNIVMAPEMTPLITLNFFDSRARQRFTCAHEIGHYIRRTNQGDLTRRQVFIDRRAQLAGAGTDQDEIYANQFAAALLMPARLVNLRYMVDGWTPDQLAREFLTSEQAMNIRLRNLRLV